MFTFLCTLFRYENNRLYNVENNYDCDINIYKVLIYFILSFNNKQESVIPKIFLYLLIIIYVQHCINYIQTFNTNLILDYFLTTQKTWKAKFEQYKVLNATSRFFWAKIRRCNLRTNGKQKLVKTV